ncbi:MAG: phosphotransferase family protein [Sphingomonadaceae bacterium]
MAADLEAQLASAVTALWGEEASVSELARFHGGAARETWRFVAEAADRRAALVMRRDPAASLITTSRAVEFHVLDRASRAGLPAPRPLLLDMSGDTFGSAGFLMEAVEGGRAAGLFETDPYGRAAATTGRELFAVLGRLHALPVSAADRAVLPDHPPAARLAHWAREIAQHSTYPQPVAQAALRWLEAHCPEPSGPPALVHGDFRSGNFLVDSGNRLLAVLDWEMAHLGDPMEDLAWAADPLWGHGETERVGAMLPLADAIAAWEQASGRRFAAEVWPWWQLFASFAGLAIWISSGFEVAQLRTVDPVMAFSAYYPYRFHNARVARLLAELAG